MNKKKLLVCCGVFAGCLASAYAFSVWLFTSPEPIETQEPVLWEDWKEVPCDPFREIQENRESTVAKYKGKTVILAGIVGDRRHFDGYHVIHCVGLGNAQFSLHDEAFPDFFTTKVANPDFERLKYGHRVIVHAEMDPRSGGCTYFHGHTLWKAEIQEIQEWVPRRFAKRWKTIWKRD